MLLDNGFNSDDLRLLDGRVFTRNQDGKAEEIDHSKNVIAFNCRDGSRDTDDDCPF